MLELGQVRAKGPLPLVTAQPQFLVVNSVALRTSPRLLSRDQSERLPPSRAGFRPAPHRFCYSRCLGKR